MRTDLKLEILFYTFHVSARGLVEHLVMAVISNIHCMFQSFILTVAHSSPLHVAQKYLNQKHAADL